VLLSNNTIVRKKTIFCVGKRTSPLKYDNYSGSPVWTDESRFSVLLLGSSSMLGVSLVVAMASTLSAALVAIASTSSPLQQVARRQQQAIAANTWSLKNMIANGNDEINLNRNRNQLNKSAILIELLVCHLVNLVHWMTEKRAWLEICALQFIIII